MTDDDRPEDPETAADRIRARLARRDERERRGLRRYRPGPGSAMYSPSTGGRGPVPEEVLDPQIEAIRRALAQHGPTERTELARLVGARYWGPGVFRAALRIAVSGGEVRRLGRHLFTLPDDPGTTPARP